MLKPPVTMEHIHALPAGIISPFNCSMSENRTSFHFPVGVVLFQRAVHRQHEGVLRVIYQRPAEQTGRVGKK